MAAVAVFMMIMVAFAPMASIFTDDQGSDAATASAVSDVKIQIFTADSADFNDLIYCCNDSDELPETVDATEYVQLGETGVWININENSAKYGMFLRYGDTGMSKEAILEQAEEVDNWIPLIQTSFKYTQNTDVMIAVNDVIVQDSETVTLTKGGLANGAVFSAVESVYTVKFIEGNVAPCLNLAEDELSGTYDVDVYINGVLNKSASFVIGVPDVTISGVVLDAGTVPINGATVKYTVDGKSNTVVTKKIGTGDSAVNGAYEIKVQPGSVVAITEITYPDDAYTFDASYSFGTVSVNTEAEDFHANETTLSTSVVDASEAARAIVGATVTAQWYSQKAGEEEDDKYFVKKLTTGSSSVIGVTNEDGIAIVTYKAPEAVEDWEDLLVVSATKAIGYTFDDATISTSTTANKDPIATQIEDKLATGALEDGTTSAELSAVESSFIVTVKESNSENPVVGATVTAQWYSEKAGDSDPVKYFVKKSSTGSSSVIGVTNEDGIVVVTYVTPTEVDTWTDSLVISATKSEGYTFDFVTISTSTTANKASIEDQIGTSVATVMSGLDDGDILCAVEAGYKISGTITLTSAASEDLVVKVAYTDGIGESVDVEIAEGETGRTYSFYVLENASPTITPSLTGYEFVYSGTSYSKITLPSVTVDVDDVDFTGTLISADVDLIVPTLHDEIPGIEFPGTEETEIIAVTFEYTVNGKNYKSTIMSEWTLVEDAEGEENDVYAQVATLNVYAFGTTITVTSVESEGYEFAVDGTGAYVVVGAIQDYAFFAYTIVGDSTKLAASGYSIDIYNDDGKFVGNIKTGADGMAKISTGYTIGSTTSYKYGAYTFNATGDEPVAGIIQLNLTDFAKGVSYVTVSISYETAYTMGGETSTPGVHDISSDISTTLVVGSTVKFTAPSFNGFAFKGWYSEGQLLSDKADLSYTAVGTATGTASLSALYSATADNSGTPGVSNVVIVIGAIAVIIALIAVAYVVIQTKKKD